MLYKNFLAFSYSNAVYLGTKAGAVSQWPRWVQAGQKGKENPQLCPLAIFFSLDSVSEKYSIMKRVCLLWLLSWSSSCLVLVAFMCFVFVCFVFSSPQAAKGNCTSQHSYGCFLCVGFVQEATFSKQTANAKNKLEGWAFFYIMNKYKCLLLEVLQQKMEHWVVLVPCGCGGTVCHSFLFSCSYWLK